MWRNVQRIGDPTGCGDVQDEVSGDVFANGRGIARLGDNSAGHCYTPVPVDTASGNVYANGIPVARLGDTHPVHCCGSSCHLCGPFPAGSDDVFVN